MPTSSTRPLACGTTFRRWCRIGLAPPARSMRRGNTCLRRSLSCPLPGGAPGAILTAAGTVHTYENVKIEDMFEAVDRATDLLKSLASRNRLLLLCHLVGGEKSVGDLARLIGARDTAVSQQLALLRKDGLVRTRRDAQTIYYSLASAEAAKVIETLHGVFCAEVPADARADRGTTLDDGATD